MARPSDAPLLVFEERRQLCRADLDGLDQPQGGQGFVRLFLHERCLLDHPMPRRSGTAWIGGCVGFVGVDLDDRKRKNETTAYRQGLFATDDSNQNNESKAMMTIQSYRFP
jgi:hypothetical protein